MLDMAYSFVILITVLFKFYLYFLIHVECDVYYTMVDI